MAAQKVWLSSDLHFRHRMVAGKRGFLTPAGTPDMDAHDEAIVANWNAHVAPHDIAWILGDITLGSAKLAWPYVDRLNGDKRVIAGNHDEIHAMHRNACKYAAAWREHFTAVIPSYVRMRLEGEEVLLAHHPYEGDSGPVDRDVQYRLRDMGKTIVHGHVHGSGGKITFTLKGTLQIHVGLDAHELAPVEMAWVQEEIRREQAIRDITRTTEGWDE